MTDRLQDEVSELKVSIAHVQGSLVNLHGKMDALADKVDTFHDHVAGPMVKDVKRHSTDLVRLKTHGVWISGLIGVASSWLGLKLFGKG